MFSLIFFSFSSFSLQIRTQLSGADKGSCQHDAWPRQINVRLWASAHTFKSRFKTWMQKLLWSHSNTQTKDNTIVVVAQRRYLQVKALTWTDMLKRNSLDVSTYARVNTYQSGVFEFQWRVSPLCLLPCWNVGVNDMLNIKFNMSIWMDFDWLLLFIMHIKFLW